jgi:16S rRNA (guanine527-N7)-methyltransferase
VKHPARIRALSETYGLPPDAAGRLGCLLEVLAADDHAPTPIRMPQEAVDAHIADSLVALDLPVVRDATVIADLGSGAGFPGLPLAAALPGARVALVESAARKAAFITRAARAMGLANATVLTSRAEDFRDGIGVHDLVTVRALAPLPVLVEYAAPLLAMNGALVAWKGRADPGEEADGAAAAAQTGLELAEIRAVRPWPKAQNRTLYVYLKVGSTPKRYPRRAGMARKRPLSAGFVTKVEGS